MSTSFRVLAAAGILILAASGCGKGKDTASASGMHKGDVAKSGPKSGKGAKSMKSGTASHSSEKEKSKAATATASRAVAHSGVLTSDDNGMEIDLRQGQVVTVVLDSNKASGLGWVLVEPAGSVVVMQGGPAYSTKSGKRGSGGTETWHFRAAKPGHQTVKMEYRRKWATSVPERTFRFDANVR
jgi:inhibitor of cysteine peptidase